MLKIAIIAGEISGDIFAAELITQLIKLHDSVEFVGIGGSQMQAAGCESWYEMSTLSVMGYLEVLCSGYKLLKLRYAVLHKLLSYKPDLFIGVDAPDFNFFIEKKLKQAGITTMHYISPSIWAWRYKRIYNIKDSTDIMLCIFPFEPAIYATIGMRALYVGNPLAQGIELDIETEQYKQRLGFAADKYLITVLVGSRKAEINYLAKTLIDTCIYIYQQLPTVHFLFPISSAKLATLLTNKLAKYPTNIFCYTIIVGNTRNAIQAADLVIAKSGTVSLESALCKKPMIICYKTNYFMSILIRKLITIKFIGQPNILAGTMIVPEFIQEDATAQNMSTAIIALYHNKTLQQQMITDCYTLHQRLLIQSSITAAEFIKNELI